MQKKKTSMTLKIPKKITLEKKIFLPDISSPISFIVITGRDI